MPRRSRSPLVGSGTAAVAVQDEFRNLLAAAVVPAMLPNPADTGEPAAFAVIVMASETI